MLDWSVLPDPGGLYQQRPEILEAFQFILTEQVKERERQEAKQKREQGKTMSSRSPGGRRRS